MMVSRIFSGFILLTACIITGGLSLVSWWGERSEDEESQTKVKAPLREKILFITALVLFPLLITMCFFFNQYFINLLGEFF